MREIIVKIVNKAFWSLNTKERLQIINKRVE